MRMGVMSGGYCWVGGGEDNCWVDGGFFVHACEWMGGWGGGASFMYACEWMGGWGLVHACMHVSGGGRGLHTSLHACECVCVCGGRLHSCKHVRGGGMRLQSCVMVCPGEVRV